MVLEIAGTFYKLSGIEIIGHISFAFAAMSFFVRDMLFLRSFAIISGMVGITFNYFIQVGPLWIPIFWLSFFICKYNEAGTTPLYLKVNNCTINLIH